MKLKSIAYIIVATGAILFLSCKILYNDSKKINEQISVTVNTNTVLAIGINNKYGINLNAAIDSDADRPTGSRTLIEAIEDMGIKYLRYPGGKKSMLYFWSAAPYVDPSTNYWVPGYYSNNAKSTIDFDQFMSICHQTGAIPHINVGYNPAVGLDENVAAAWVRYANVTKGYEIKYWEIGNEMWQKYLGFTASTLAEVVAKYSRAMKAVDSSIKIGVSWQNLPEIIAECGDHIDFVNISNYVHGIEGLKSYEAYANTANVDFLKMDTRASKQIIISEFSPIIWDNTDWDATNNLGKGLMNFDFIGQILKSAKCEYACFWNTRWYNNDKPIYNALDDNNNLTPVAKSMVLWRMFIKEKLVSSTSETGSIVTYAAYDSDNGDLNVFVINKATTTQAVHIGISSKHQYMKKSNVWQYKGTGYSDENPVVQDAGTVRVSGNKISGYNLPATSITTFVLKKKK
jgi:alpha-L-arabinofuranosidase